MVKKALYITNLGNWSYLFLVLLVLQFHYQKDLYINLLPDKMPTSFWCIILHGFVLWVSVTFHLENAGYLF